MSRSQWTVGDGPWASPQQVVDGVGWGYELVRGQTRRSVTVIVNRRAFAPGADVATRTRVALRTKGRSEARRVARMQDPPRVVVLGRRGSLSAPPTLRRDGI